MLKRIFAPPSSTVTVDNLLKILQNDMVEKWNDRKKILKLLQKLNKSEPLPDNADTLIWSLAVTRNDTFNLLRDIELSPESPAKTKLLWELRNSPEYWKRHLQLYVDDISATPALEERILGYFAFVGPIRISPEISSRMDEIFPILMSKYENPIFRAKFEEGLPPRPSMSYRMNETPENPPTPPPRFSPLKLPTPPPPQPEITIPIPPPRSVPPRTTVLPKPPTPPPPPYVSPPRKTTPPKPPLEIIHPVPSSVPKLTIGLLALGNLIGLAYFLKRRRS